MLKHIFATLTCLVSLNAFSDTGKIKWYEPEKGYGMINSDSEVRFYGNKFYFKATSLNDYGAFIKAVQTTKIICVSFELEKIVRSGDVQAKNIFLIDCK